MFTFNFFQRKLPNQYIIYQIIPVYSQVAQMFAERKFGWKVDSISAGFNVEERIKILIKIYSLVRTTLKFVKVFYTKFSIQISPKR